MFGGSNYKKNSFTNSYVGVFVNSNEDVTIASNTFNNLTTGASIYNCKTAGNVIAVNYNTIDDCATGIYGYDNNGCTTFDVKSNKINLATAGANSKYNSKAISILNPTQSLLALPQLTILSNYIKRVGVGVEATYFTAPDIEHNVISNINDIGYSTMVEAMRITYCPTAQVKENRVTGGPSFTNFSWTAGIRIEYSSNSLVVRDTVENIGRGLFFGGDCNSSELAKNLMKDNYDGLLINAGEIGYQNGSVSSCIAPGNMWQGTSFNSHIFSNSSDGTRSATNLYGSTCSPGSGPCMNPSPFLNPVAGGTGYFAVPVTLCTTLSTRNMITGNTDYLLDVKNDRINYPIYPLSAKWMAKYNVYRMLQTDTALQTENAELKFFSDSVAQTNIGTLYRITQALTDKNADMNAATSSINGLAAENIVEKNMKEAFEIIIASRNDSVLTDTQIQTLKEIAVQCPYEGGPGVYSARVLLSTVDNTQYVNDCEVVSTQEHKSMTKVIDNSKEISVYPNPANDKLTVAIELEAGQTGAITIYDLTGKVVLSKTLNENTGAVEISTALLSDGMYLYKINVNNTPVSTGKLSIIR